MALDKPRTDFKYQYRIAEYGDEEPHEFTTFYSNHGWRDWPGIAQAAANDFFHNHDGWEASWPKTFTLFDGDECLGDFEIEMEAVPEFRARPVTP